MRKIILGLAISLDGLIEGPNGEYDWCFTDQDYGLAEFYTRIDSIFIGRKSYEMLQGMGEDSMPGMPKFKEYVFTNTLENVKEGSVIVKGDIREQVEKIRNTPGKDIWLFGGASLTESFMELDLVDELWLSVHPIILGQGKPLFSNLHKRYLLELTESKTYETGLVSLRYDIKHRER